MGRSHWANSGSERLPCRNQRWVEASPTRTGWLPGGILARRHVVVLDAAGKRGVLALGDLSNSTAVEGEGRSPVGIGTGESSKPSACGSSDRPARPLAAERTPRRQCPRPGYIARERAKRKGEHKSGTFAANAGRTHFPLLRRPSGPVDASAGASKPSAPAAAKSREQQNISTL